MFWRIMWIPPAKRSMLCAEPPLTVSPPPRSTRPIRTRGATQKRYQSGEIDWSGRVSKCGDSAMRGLLFEAASSVIHQVKRFSRLKSWAMRLARRRGFRKAAVATARKLAVLMLTLWKNGTDYQWTKETTA